MWPAKPKELPTPGLVVCVSELYSQLEGRGLESHPVLYGNGVKTMHPILVHSINQKKENIGSQMWHTKKKNFNWGLVGQIKSFCPRDVCVG